MIRRRAARGRLAVVVEEAHQAAQQAGERHLVLPGCRTVSSARASSGREVELAQPLVGESRHGVAQLVVVQHQRQARPPRCRAPAASCVGVRRFGQPLARPAAGPARVAEPLADDLGGEEVLADEASQPFADLVLLARDDRGVRDRQPQRVPEQRGHREPVGEAADHGRLGGRLDVAPAPVAVADSHAADDEDRGGDDQQAAGDDLHPAQRPQPLGGPGRGSSPVRSRATRGDRRGEPVGGTRRVAEEQRRLGQLEFDEHGPVRRRAAGRRGRTAGVPKRPRDVADDRSAPAPAPRRSGSCGEICLLDEQRRESPVDARCTVPGGQHRALARRRG